MGSKEGSVHNGKGTKQVKATTKTAAEPKNKAVIKKTTKAASAAAKDGDSRVTPESTTGIIDFGDFPDNPDNPDNSDTPDRTDGANSRDSRGNRGNMSTVGNSDNGPKEDCRKPVIKAYRCRDVCFYGGKLWKQGDIQHSAGSLDPALWQCLGGACD